MQRFGGGHEGLIANLTFVTFVRQLVGPKTDSFSSTSCSRSMNVWVGTGPGWLISVPGVCDQINLQATVRGATFLGKI